MIYDNIYSGKILYKITFYIYKNILKVTVCVYKRHTL